MAPSSDPDPPDDPDRPSNDWDRLSGAGSDAAQTGGDDEESRYGFVAGSSAGGRPESEAEAGRSEPPVDDRSAPTDDPDATFSEDPVRWLLSRLLAVGTGYGLAVVAFFFGSVIYLIGRFVLAGFGVSDIYLSLSVFVFLQGIAFPGVALVYLGFRWGLARVREREWGDTFVRLRVPGLKDLAWTVGGYVGMIALVGVSLFLVTLLNAPTAQRSDQAILQNPEALLLMLPISFLLIGPGEELLFRGIIQDRLRESFSAPSAILLASGAFAPLHIFALAGGVQALLVTIGVLFVPSLIFGITYEVTDNLTVPVLIHGAYDATIFGFAYISLTAGGSAALGLPMLA